MLDFYKGKNKVVFLYLCFILNFLSCLQCFLYYKLYKGKRKKINPKKFVFKKNFVRANQLYLVFPLIKTNYSELKPDSYQIIRIRFI